MENEGNDYGATSQEYALLGRVVLAGLTLNQSLVPMDVTGYCDANVVLTWVQHWLIPAL